jgi:hypothetical protein
MQFIRGTIEDFDLQTSHNGHSKKRRYVYSFTIDSHTVKLKLNSLSTLKDGDHGVIFGEFKQDHFKAKGIKNTETNEIINDNTLRLGFQVFSNFLPLVLFLTVFSDFFARFKGQSDLMVLSISVFDLVHYGIICAALFATVYSIMTLLSTLNTNKKLLAWTVQ